MMQGTSPYLTHQSPSFHSSSYIPKLEANFMRDFTCCDRIWPTLHDLLQHYEENHTQPTPQSMRNFGQMPGLPSAQRTPSARPVPSTPTMTQQTPMQAQGQMGQQNRQVTTPPGGMGMGGIGQMMRQQQQAMPGSSGQKHVSMSQLNDEMDAVGDMEMDDALGPMDMDDSQTTIQQTRQMFGQQQRPQLHLNSSGLPQQALRTSQPTTPAAASFGFQNNPTVSSVNTPTLTTQPFSNRGQAQFGDITTGDMDEDLPGMSMKMNLGNLNLNGLNGNQFNMGFGNGTNGGLDFGTIDDPAKRLYSPGGGMINQQRNINNQFAQFGLDPSQFPPGTDTAALLQQLAPLVMQEEHKPFKCPVIGCEKAYKNQNGLKYHKTHGHSTQQLHENGDGTFSIVNPETSAPYPGTMGMEKEKPFKCDVCGKRYKNLNGLKYVSFSQI